MKKTQKLFNKVAVFSLVLSTIIFFGSCKRTQDTPDNLSQGQFATSSASFATTTTGTSYTVDLTGIKSDGGYAYKTTYPLSSSGDSNTAPTVSTLRLFENGVELSPAHSLHDDIRNLGKGRFSHWGTSLYFSASDNTNPATNGRKYTYTFDGSASGTTTTITTPTTTTTTTTGSATKTGVTSALMGYAMYNGTTTGGAGGTTVTVSTLAALKTALSGSAPKIVYVSGTIAGSGDDPVYVSSNKSIIGQPGAKITGISLYMFTVNNIIVQNITFKNYVTDAALMIKFSTTHVWVDHCDFSTDRNHGWDYWGKDIAITRASDFVTVSWSRFHDTNLSLLISGGIAGHESDIGHLHVTLHHNFWYNVSEREPDMNYGRVHVFNNYHLNNSSYSLGARANGIIRTDNEYFSGCHKPISTNLAGDPPGYFSGVSTNIYSNCGANDITTPLSTWIPEYTYSSVLDVAANVPAIVQNGAGAILSN
ncbi:polysaccharide lyase family 1 protein [Mucilaginibacter sp. AW1-7]|jgi:pectate lyase|uniref:pectate lyase family protein n=1 Tax=Mucilaginibacter sp. AW1-7 TaxID=3349874 RepID=UPI003F73F077